MRGVPRRYWKNWRPRTAALQAGESNHDRRRHRLHRPHRTGEVMARLRSTCRIPSRTPAMCSSQAIERARIDPAEVEDVIVGATFLEGASGANVARQVALARRLPGHHRGRIGEPLLLIGPADHRARGATGADGRGRDLCSRRPGVDFAASRTRPTPDAQGGLGRRAQASGVLEHAADRRDGRKALRHPAPSPGRVRRAKPAARGRRGSRRGVFNDEIVPFKTTMAVADKECGHHRNRRGHPDRRRGHSPRHHLRGGREDSACRSPAA